jgi:P27 family predicted phage terminase small subunit
LPAKRIPSKVMAEPRRNRSGLQLVDGREEVEQQIGGAGLDWQTVPPEVTADDRALQCWEHLARTFADQATRFREGERWMVSGLCQALSVFAMAMDDIRERGILVRGRDLSEVKNPSTAVANMALGHVRMYCVELGLSPRARNMLGLADKPDQSAENDYLFGFSGEQ